jgi:hypothetical protein
VDAEDYQRKSHEAQYLIDATGLESADTEVGTILDNKSCATTLQPEQYRQCRKDSQKGIDAQKQQYKPVMEVFMNVWHLYYCTTSVEWYSIIVYRNYIAARVGFSPINETWRIFGTFEREQAPLPSA